MKQEPTQEPSPEEDLIAALSFTVDKSGEIFLDIQVEDFSDDVVDGLANMITQISTVKFQLITLDMIKHAFLEEDEYEKFVKLVAKITALQASQAGGIMDMLKDSDVEEPCIKPSDML